MFYAVVNLSDHVTIFHCQLSVYLLHESENMQIIDALLHITCMHNGGNYFLKDYSYSLLFKYVFTFSQDICNYF